MSWDITEKRHPLGRLVSANAVRYERCYPVGAAPVWREIAEPQRFGTWWFPSPVKTDLRVGGRISFGDMGATVMDLEPERFLAFAFDNGSGALFRLAPARGGTEV